MNTPSMNHITFHVFGVPAEKTHELVTKVNNFFYATCEGIESEVQVAHLVEVDDGVRPNDLVG